MYLVIRIFIHNARKNNPLLWLHPGLDMPPLKNSPAKWLKRGSVEIRSALGPFRAAPCREVRWKASTSPPASARLLGCFVFQEWEYSVGQLLLWWGQERHHLVTAFCTGHRAVYGLSMLPPHTPVRSGSYTFCIPEILGMDFCIFL